MLKGSSPGAVIELDQTHSLLGRHTDCQVPLDSTSVSRHHAQIVQRTGRFYLKDLGSRNGTLHNGQKIEREVELGDRDEIGVCEFVFTFYRQLLPGQTPESFKSTIIEMDVHGLDIEGHLRKTTPLPVSDTDIEIDTPALERAEIAKRSGIYPDLPAHFDDGDEDSSSIIAFVKVESKDYVKVGKNPEAMLQAVLDMSNKLGQVFELDQVVTALLDGLFQIFEHAAKGVVMLPDPETGELQVKASQSKLATPQKSVRISKTIVEQARENRMGILVEDAVQDQRFQGSESISSMQLRSVICVPLVGKASDVIGVIQVSTSDARFRFTQADLELLVSIASQGSLAIANANMHAALMQQRDLDRELQFGKEVQRDLLPSTRPELAGYQFSDYYQAAHQLGGDYFDYLTLPDGRVAVAVADVAGKGVPAALLMSKLYSSVSHQLHTQTTGADALAALNAEFASSGAGHRFITCVIAIIDPVAEEISIVNAGHLPPLRIDADGNLERMGQADSGLPLGILNDQVYRELKFPFQPGDAWLLYTDGVTESMNPRNELYGNDRLCRFVADHSSDPEALVTGVVTDVRSFSDGQLQSDDICLVGFRRLS